MTLELSSAPIERQPVHTLYGGAHLFKAETVRTLGALAARSLASFGANPQEFAATLGIPPDLASQVHARVSAKLDREPIEDYRIDFEDGYGHRSAEEEDHHATQAAREVAAALEAGTLPPFCGIRIKALTEAQRPRAGRTLDLFLTTLLEATGNRLPPGFAVTLPKVSSIEQVATLHNLLSGIESGHSLQPGAIRVELMVETPQSIFDSQGRVALPALVDAAAGRCRGAHFGPYDYTAALGIAAGDQGPAHPACDFARHVMQVSLAGRNVALADGPTNILPIPPHRDVALTPEQDAENQRVVYRAWRLHYDDVQRSLRAGFYQSWDLHPAQLPSRYAAVFTFFLQSLPSASARLSNFLEQAKRATRVGDVFDDAATVLGLVNFFRRGLNCGALTETEASVARTALIH